MSETKTTGISVGGLLGVAFVVLKLTGAINWSWWWVTCPFWIGFTILLLIGFIAGVAFVVASLFAGKSWYRRNKQWKR